MRMFQPTKQILLWHAMAPYDGHGFHNLTRWCALTSEVHLGRNILYNARCVRPPDIQMGKSWNCRPWSSKRCVTLCHSTASRASTSHRFSRRGRSSPWTRSLAKVFACMTANKATNCTSSARNFAFGPNIQTLQNARSTSTFRWQMNPNGLCALLLAWSRWMSDQTWIIRFVHGVWSLLLAMEPPGFLFLRVLTLFKIVFL